MANDTLLPFSILHSAHVSSNLPPPFSTPLFHILESVNHHRPFSPPILSFLSFSTQKSTTLLVVAVSVLSLCAASLCVYSLSLLILSFISSKEFSFLLFGEFPIQNTLGSFRALIEIFLLPTTTFLFAPLFSYLHTFLRLSTRGRIIRLQRNISSVAIY